MHTDQRRRTVTVISVVVTVVSLAAYVAFAPAGPGAEVRALVGISDRTPGDAPGAHFAFLQTQPGSNQPVGWDPCRPIRYVVNPDGAPQGWESLVADGIAAVADASGLEFVAEGTTDDRDFDDRDPRGFRPDPVLIGWADEAEVTDLEGDVAGLGGAVSVQTGIRWRFTTGSLVLDTEAFERLDDRRRGRDIALAILLHELGHVVGLGHVDDRGELMYQDGVPRPSFGPGDLAGLEELGNLRCG